MNSVCYRCQVVSRLWFRMNPLIRNKNTDINHTSTGNQNSFESQACIPLGLPVMQINTLVYRSSHNKSFKFKFRY